MKNLLKPQSFKFLTQNHQDSHQDSLYTQTYQCHCQMTFKTLRQYQSHLQQLDHLQHHQLAIQDFHLQSTPLFQKKPSQQDPNPGFSLFPSKPEVFKSKFSLNQNIKSRNIETQNAVSKSFDNALQNQIFQENQQPFTSLNQSKTEQISLKQKYFNLKYSRAYYQQKMAPFYRQFDIEPYKSAQSQRNTYQNAYKLQTGNRGLQISLEDSYQQIRRTAFIDKKKIDQQIAKRMAPVEIGIVEFLINFVYYHQKQIKSMTYQQREQISRQFFDKIAILQQLFIQIHQKSQAQSQDQKSQEDFFETDIYRALKTFMRFLSEKLGRCEICITEAILTIVVDTIIEYYTVCENRLCQNLKVSDLPYLFLKIQLNSEKYNFPFQIDPSTTNQFIFWFTQWCNMLQFINNKGRTDYIEPLLNQINQINTIYSQNFANYQKLIQKRMHDFKKKVKSKIILKNKKNLEKRLYVKKESDFMANPPQDTYDLDKENEVNKNLPSRVFQPIQFGHVRQRNACQENIFNNHELQISNRFEDYCKKNAQQKMEITKSVLDQNSLKGNRKKTGQYSSLASHFNETQKINDRLGNQDLRQSKDMSQSNFTIVQSKYINYFSPELIEQRRKDQQIWKQRTKYLQKIADNPNIFKPFMKNQVSEQIKEIEILFNTIEDESKMHNPWRKDYMNKLKYFHECTKGKEDIQQITIQKKRQFTKPEIDIELHLKLNQSEVKLLTSVSFVRIKNY